MKDYCCDFCEKEKVVLAQTDGARLYFPIGEFFTTLELKPPLKYFPLRCGRCGEITLWRGKSID